MDNLERCARAIHASAVRSGSSFGNWDDQPDDYRQRCMIYAAAAVAESRRWPLWDRARTRMSEGLRAADRSISHAVAQSFDALRRARY